ncbi:MAG TPA: acyl-CoA dehydrogenase family protein [Steroidobacteraceae bacterium]|nr:acyl-CoA dehydrogenase family protein [Steroidobacteraceae bacterium]
MAFDLDERRLLERTLGDFLGDACSLERRRAALAADEPYDERNWRTLAEMGVLALPMAESDGGLGGSVADLVTVARLLGSALSTEPYLPCAILPARLLASFAGDSRRSGWLKRLAAGEVLLGFAHHERGAAAIDAPPGTRVHAGPPGLRLTGRKLHVPLARVLAGFIVSAIADDGSTVLCLAPADARGIHVRSYRLVDAQLAGEVTFEDVPIRTEDVLWTDADRAVREALDLAAAVAAADSVGCMQQLIERTAQYLNDRKQFGQPIGRFQALKHRLVDAYAALEQASALLGTVGHERAHGWSARVAAAKAFVDRQGVRVGHEAMQMHGAMGLTDELAISHYHKRILCNAGLYGGPDAQLDRLWRDWPVGDPQASSAALPFAESLGSDELAFQREVQAFLASELDTGLRLATRRLTCTFLEREFTDAWQARLHRRGWLAPLWPREHGGTGWTAVRRFLFEYECALAGAPERIPMGLRYVGPIVAQFGSASQQQYFLPRILSGEHYWAQGFSEPGAGSDLAAVRTTAVLDGEHYLVNGTKIWTTNAHFADWIFCLVRTSATGRPQEGISFLLVDLRSPGIRIEPITLLAGDHEVNQVFFDDVRVPRANLVGEAGRGWEYAKFLLELERGGTLHCGRVRAEFNAIKEHVADVHRHLYEDGAWQRRCAELEVRLMALEAFEFRTARTMTAATDPGVGGSVIKLVASELHQDVTQFGVEVAGIAALELEPSRPLAAPEQLGYPGPDLDLVAMPRYLNTRATTIYAGSSEIQREIIAKHVLGFRS